MVCHSAFIQKSILLGFIIIMILFHAATCSVTTITSNDTPSRRRIDNNSVLSVPGKTIWLLWLSGWHDDVPWISQQVAQSWAFHNPTWNIELLTADNLHLFVDITYLSMVQSRQAQSDIIRLYLLEKHGGVWADATMICMAPLDDWVYDALAPSGFWMYHGGARSQYPASWFMVSVRNSSIIHQWRVMCDEYWAVHNKPHNYFWMDSMFNKRIKSDDLFMYEWKKVPFLSCEDKGQAHLYRNNIFKPMDNEILEGLINNAPYAIKLSSKYPRVVNETNLSEIEKSRGYITVQMSKVRRKVNHTMIYNRHINYLQEMKVAQNESSAGSIGSSPISPLLSSFLLSGALTETETIPRSSLVQDIYVRCSDMYEGSKTVRWSEFIRKSPQTGYVVVRDTCNMCKDFPSRTAYGTVSSDSALQRRLEGLVCIPAALRLI